MEGIDVVYENGVFKPISKVKLKEGTKAKVVIEPNRIIEIARKHRKKVDDDVLKEFLAERK